MKSILALGVLGVLSNCKLTTGSRYDSDDQYDLQIFGNLGNLGLGVLPGSISTQTTSTQPLPIIPEQNTQEALPNYGNAKSSYGNSNINIQLTESENTKGIEGGFEKKQEYVIQDRSSGKGGIGVQNGYNAQGGYAAQGAFGLPGFQSQRSGFGEYSISQGLGSNNYGFYQNPYQNIYSQNSRQSISTRPQSNNLRYDSYFPSSIPLVPQFHSSQSKVKTMSGVSINENGDQIKYTYTEEVISGERPSN